ncbi:MAG: hypothetical protein JW893_03065 [Candidatus Omnitrophica bacterium]|nr:hypothetical protein [Candidatus Omnitrophota bacterium]
MPNFLLFLVSSILALTLGCLIIDVSHYFLRRDPFTFISFDSYLGWSPIPNLSLPDRPSGSIHTNSKGFRSEEIDPKRSQILIAGDSVAWGYGLPDNQTLSFYLQNKLKNEQVQNLAVPGYGLDQSYLRLKSDIGQIPYVQHVILVLFANDLEDIATNTLYGKRKPLFRFDGTNLKLTGVPVQRFNIRNLLAESWLYKRFVEPSPVLANLFSKMAGDKKISIKEASDICEILLEQLVAFLKEKGADLTVVLSPSRNEFSDRSEAYKWFENFLSDHKINFIDGATLIARKYPGDQRTLYWDGAHYSASGNALLAEIIFDALFRETNNQPESGKELR